MTPPVPPSDLRARVLAAARREPSPPRAAVERSTFVVIGLGIAALAAIFTAIGGADLTTRPRSFLAMTAIGWSVIALASTWAGVARGRSMLGRSTPALAVVALATGPTLFAWMTLGTSLWPGTVGYDAPLRLHLVCFALTMAMTIGPFLALVIVRRASDPIHPRASTAALGAVAGAWASVMIDLHCPVSEGSHVALAHVLPIVVFAAIGALIGRRASGVRGG